MRSSHRSATEAGGLSITGVPGRENVGSRSPDVSAATPVGETRLLITLRSRVDVQGGAGAAGGKTATISVIVARCSHHQETSGGGSIDSSIHSPTVTRAQREVGNAGLAGSASARSGPVDTSDDPVKLAPSVRTTENLHRVDVDLLSNTIKSTTDRTSNMGTVSVDICSISVTGEVRARQPIGAATKLGVSDSDTSVQDVHVDATSTVGVVSEVGRGRGSTGGDSG